MAMFLLMRLLLFVVSVQSISQKTFVGVDFVFLSNPNTPSALLVDANGNRIAALGGSEISYCAYLYFYSNGTSRYRTFISYATNVHPISRNEFLIEFDLQTGESIIEIGNSDRRAKAKPGLDHWTHICATWSGSTGIVRLYFDGVEVVKLENFHKGMTIRGDGYLVVGQEQDEFDGGFEAVEGFEGRITQFNGWRKELTPHEVRLVQTYQLYGDLVDWRTANWALSDHLMVDYTGRAKGGNCKVINECRNQEVLQFLGQDVPYDDKWDSDSLIINFNFAENKANDSYLTVVK